MTDSSTESSTAPAAGNGMLAAFSEGLSRAIALAGQSTVAVHARHRMGSSGVHWRPGFVVTADHTIKREDDITLTLPNGQTVAAALVGRDSSTDLAVLNLEESACTVADLGDASSLSVGHIVLAAGRSAENGLSASMGVVSALGGGWRTWHGGQIDQFVRPDVTLYPGFSGGPLVDVQGRIIGINTSGPRHLALTIPAVTVNRVVDQLAQRGRISRGYLGVGLQPVRLPPALTQTLHLEQTAGVIVLSIEAGGPSDTAGVLIGDVLLSLGGTPVGDIADVYAKLSTTPVGTPLTAQIVRGGGLVQIEIVVGDRP
ncbi:MAG: trypsin-like peptidase domain-containing protein [Cyanobacteria bacterium J069]